MRARNVDPSLCGESHFGWDDYCHLPKGHEPPCLDADGIEERDLIADATNGDMARVLEVYRYGGPPYSGVIAALVARVKRAEAALVVVNPQAERRRGLELSISDATGKVTPEEVQFALAHMGDEDREDYQGSVVALKAACEIGRSDDGEGH
jgi:hypothetical protein